MKTYLQRGFTLIELLVVIAIIGILSSIVLASLNSARGKGGDSAIKGDLATVRTQVELWYDDASKGNGKYSTTNAIISNATCSTAVTANTFLSDTTIQSAFKHAEDNSTGDGSCNISANGAAYAVAFPLKSGGVWCIDNTGVARAKSAAGVAYVGTYGAAPAAIGTGLSACR